MKANVTWAGGRTFIGGVEAGHKIVLGNAHGDSLKPGPSPMELILIGTGDVRPMTWCIFWRRAARRSRTASAS